MSAPISRVSVPDQVFERLRRSILSGDYRAGERLPTQRTLAADLQVNMATVREALKRLEQLRLVEIRHGDATRVLDWRRSGGLEALMLQGGGEHAIAGDLFEARRLLLVEAARLAAARRSPQQAAALLELAEAVALVGEDQAALLADWEFMEALVEAAGNLVFQLIMNSVRELYLPRADAFAALVADRRRLAKLYRRAAVCVGDGDGDGAASAIEQLAEAQEAMFR
jgi:GntR family transcriptional repressor for pyruvate dehydrogenase complex